MLKTKGPYWPVLNSLLESVLKEAFGVHRGNALVSLWLHAEYL